MTDRERFLATMHYRPRDRAPICDFSFWPETIDEWKHHGLPDWVGRNYDQETQNRFFGMDRYGGGVGANPGMCPGFEFKVLEDRGDHELIQQGDGVIVLKKKHMSSIPEHHGHLLTNRASWEEHYKWRFDPTDPRRFPSDWDEARKIWNDPAYPYPHCASGGSFYGWIRDWMGMENLSYLVYDDPALFEEMLEVMTDCKVGVLNTLYEKGAKYDCCSIWEDMCYNNGPLLAPEHFKKYLVPQIKRVTSILLSHGCDVVWVDCDGKIDELLPLWLEAGVNCMFPIEVGTWGGDPVKFRKQYGKELLMMGGFGKQILSGSREGIENEIMRLTPLVEEGGFIPMPDHRVPPDVPLPNYMHYLETARRVWGKGINLRPVGALEPS